MLVALYVRLGVRGPGDEMFSLATGDARVSVMFPVPEMAGALRYAVGSMGIPASGVVSECWVVFFRWFPIWGGITFCSGGIYSESKLSPGLYCRAWLLFPTNTCKLSFPSGMSPVPAHQATRLSNQGPATM